MSMDLVVKELLSLAQVMKNQIKGKYCWKSSILLRKIETSVHALIKDDF